MRCGTRMSRLHQCRLFSQELFQQPVVLDVCRFHAQFVKHREPLFQACSRDSAGGKYIRLQCSQNSTQYVKKLISICMQVLQVYMIFFPVIGLLDSLVTQKKSANMWNNYLIHLNFRAPLIFAQTCAKINGSENMIGFGCAKVNGSEIFKKF